MVARGKLRRTGVTNRASLARVLLITIASVCLAALAVEGLLQAYVHLVVKQGKLFESNGQTGWRTLPNLDLVRTNVDGGAWRVQTDAEGYRNFAPPHPNPHRRLLILGDSFAFGEGVNINERFDYVLSSVVPDFRVTNTGTMGFGTDQEYIASRRYVPELTFGDVILVLFYVNDFYDVLRTRFSLRPKPYFSASESGFTISYPRIGILDVLRDKSYGISLLGRLLERRADDPWDFAVAERIIEDILLRLDREKSRGVHVVLAHHGWMRMPALPNTLNIETACRAVELCLDLDPLLSDGDGMYLPDGHWTAAAHERVGRLLAQRLGNLK